MESDASEAQMTVVPTITPRIFSDPGCQEVTARSSHPPVR